MSNITAFETDTPIAYVLTTSAYRELAWEPDSATPVPYVLAAPMD